MGFFLSGSVTANNVAKSFSVTAYQDGLSYYTFELQDNTEDGAFEIVDYSGTDISLVSSQSIKFKDGSNVDYIVVRCENSTYYDVTFEFESTGMWVTDVTGGSYSFNLDVPGYDYVDVTFFPSSNPVSSQYQHSQNIEQY